MANIIGYIRFIGIYHYATHVCHHRCHCYSPFSLLPRHNIGCRCFINIHYIIRCYWLSLPRCYMPLSALRRHYIFHCAPSSRQPLLLTVTIIHILIFIGCHCHHRHHGFITAITLSVYDIIPPYHTAATGHYVRLNYHHWLIYGRHTPTRFHYHAYYYISCMNIHIN